MVKDFQFSFRNIFGAAIDKKYDLDNPFSALVDLRISKIGKPENSNLL